MGVYIKGVGKEELIEILRYENIFDAINVSSEFIEVEVKEPRGERIDIVGCAECRYKQQCHKAVQHTTRDWTSITIAYKSIDYCSYGEREDE